MSEPFEVVEPRHDTPAAVGATSALRQTMANVAASVAVVTVEVDGITRAVTISSLISLSLDPPLILFALGRASSMLVHLERRCFALTVLGAHQQEIAAALAVRGRSPVPAHWLTQIAGHAVPVIRDGAAWIVARFERTCPAGDHVVVVGHVLQAASSRIAPLIYYRRSYGVVTPEHHFKLDHN
jgi:flavin reductase (DIM6/NTAB) family NADH-FMN oxidoreductase RutF